MCNDVQRAEALEGAGTRKTTSQRSNRDVMHAWNQVRAAPFIQRTLPPVETATPYTTCGQPTRKWSVITSVPHLIVLSAVVPRTPRA
jgi:hypothetical protein